MQCLSIIIQRENNMNCLFLQGVDTIKYDTFILCQAYFELKV